uniref:Leucine-rich repeat-containing protein 70-like n=1 Tax=Diabrotica virgifera virgifera TaxID=50390 RepID=A0A6P7GVE9_DIAVI
MNNLEHIELTDTGITYVETYAFTELPKLREVILARNKLVDFDKNMFLQCPSVRLLDFGNNRIYYTKDLAIMGVIRSILHINLSNNIIKSTFINAYQGYNDRIRSLWYAHNKFGELRPGMFKLRRNLRVINFAYNEIGYIELHTFKDNPHLHTIILSYNKLFFFPVQMLPAKFYPNLKYLAMDHNWIMGFDTYNNISPLKLLTNLTKITLAGNPFYCSCLNNVLNQIKHLNVKQVCSEEEHTREICIAEEENFKPPCYLIIPINEHRRNRDYFIKENKAPTSFDPLYCVIEEFIIP